MHIYRFLFRWFTPLQFSLTSKSAESRCTLCSTHKQLTVDTEAIGVKDKTAGDTVSGHLLALFEFSYRSGAELASIVEVMELFRFRCSVV